jgi:hypothetical protein
MGTAEIDALLGPWLRSFLLTLVLEVPVFVLLARGIAPPLRAALAAAAGSCVTHPLLWFAWPLVVSDYTRYIVSGELLAALAESVVFCALARPVPWSRALAASFIANASSYGVGLVVV